MFAFDRSKFRYIKASLYNCKRRFITGFAFLLITIALTALIPWLLKGGIDAIKKSDIPQVRFYTILIVLSALLQGVTRIFSRTIIYSIGRTVEYDLRNVFMFHLYALSPSFFDNTKTGDLISRATNDISNVRMLLGPGFLQVANSTIVYLSVIPLMLLMDVRLTVYALLPYPVIILFSQFLTKALYSRSHEVQEGFGEISTKVQENLGGIDVIKSFNMEAIEEARFDAVNTKYMKKNIELARLRAVMFTLMTGLGSLTTLIILWQGGYGVVAERITLGDFVAFIGYTALLVWPTVGLGWIITVIQRGIASLDRVNDVLDKERSAKIFSGKAEESEFSVKGSIEFRELRFSYPGETDSEETTEILKGINLTIEAGERLALVGPTGVGKSTLLNLIPGMYAVETGSLFIDGADVTEIPPAQLRRHIGYVPQDCFLFSESIRDNILLNAETDESVLQKVAGHADLLKDVEEFPEKFDTVLGERGITLSGGQRQRTAIARALVNDPPVLILDDSFSNLDTQTEERILASLQEATEGKTCIIVSHRASTVRYCDRIAFMKDGRIEEIGTHVELMKKDGHYAAFFRRQLLEEEIEEMA